MPQYWFIVEALVTLAAHRKDAARPFTPADLRHWSRRFTERPTGVRHALDHMERCHLLRRASGAPSGKPLKPGTWRYQLTPEGAAAAQAAIQAQRHERQSAAITRRNQTRPRNGASFASRLWALLRMRHNLTAAEAAATLVDAGEDVAKVARTASTYLRAWVRLHPKAIQISARTAANGAYRFVLVQDLGPAGPVISDKRLREHRERAAA